MTPNPSELDGPEHEGPERESSEHKGPRRSAWWIVLAMVLVGGSLPPLLYAFVSVPITTVTPQEAREMLRQDPASTVLVDVRGPEAFSAGHLDGAVNWPLDELVAAKSPDDAPPQLRGKTLLLICNVGLASRWAPFRLERQGIGPAVNVRGGIQEWIHTVRGVDGDFDRWRTGSGEVADVPFRRSPPVEQIIATASFFLIKPVYTLLSLAVVIVLWRSRSPDLVALRWAMIAFFLGENACAVNYLALNETSYTFEYLHSLGMAVCFAFAAYAVLEGIDRRILLLSDPDRRCASLALCGSCIKHTDAPCGLKRTFYVIIPACVLVAGMLPTADWQDTVYNTVIFGEFYNYGHLRVYQQFENWCCPAAAAVMFAVSLAILAFKRGDSIGPAKIALAAGLGPLGFGMLRMVLGGAYDQNRVWYLFWEESTELLFIAGTCAVLSIFRRGLLPEWSARSA